MNVELTELRYFFNVAKTRSFAEGARRSHVTAPAISKAIKKLEESLGVQLFERTTRRVTITPSGEILLDHCQRILGSLEQLEEALESEGRALQGELRIGTMEAFSAVALPRAVARLVEAHPRVVPQIYRLGAIEQERMLLEGRLDLGLCFTPEHTLRVDSTLLAESRAVVVCGRAHPLFDKLDVGPDQLADYRFVATHELHDDRAPILPLMVESKKKVQIGATADTLPVAIQMVVDGAFLGCFPEVAIRCQLNHDELRVLPNIQAGAFEMRALTASARASVSALLEILDQTVAEALSTECAVPVSTPAQAPVAQA